MSVFSFTALFYLLLFLLMCGTLFGQTLGNGQTLLVASKNTVELFNENEEIKGSQRAERSKKIEINDYYFPVFVSTNNALVALVGFNNKTPPDNNINVLTKYIITKDGTDWEKKILVSSNSNGGGWETELAIQKNINNGAGASVAKSVFAAAKDEKIFFLLVNCTNNGAGSTSTEAICKFEIDVGSIDENVGGDQTKWKKSKPSPVSTNLKLSLEGIQLCENSIFGAAFLANEKQIIFVLQTKTKDNKNITVLVRQKETDENFEILPYNEFSKNCHPYIFPWNKKLIKFTPSCKTEEKTNIEKSTDMGTKWDNIEVPFSRLTDFLVDKKDFTMLIIKTKELIFFTQDIEPELSSKKENKYLWISDENRATKVGEITISSKSTAPVSFLYHKEKLFLFAQNCENTDLKKICLTRLGEHMTRINNVLSVWKANENNIQIPCTDAAQIARSCSTDGLVDFLSVTTGSKTEWKSNFLNVDVTINENNVVKDVNGVKFSGENKRAKWLIGEQNTKQPYNFIASGFTLVATVKIENNDKEKGNSLLGVVLTEENKRVGLWCSKDKKWAKETVRDAPLKESQKTCEQGKPYIIALVLKGKENKLFVYIDWEKQTDLTVETIKGLKQQNIKHFYFGADDGTPTVKTDVTITDVLLYNKPFTEEQINQLEIIVKKQNKQNTQTIPEDENHKLRKSAESTTDNDTLSDTPETSTTDKEDKQPSPPPPPTTEDSAARVAVDVLSLLFGVFTLLGRYVY